VHSLSLRIFFPEGGVDLVPKRGCLLTLAYYTFPRWYEFGERRWNDILTGENRRTWRKTCPSATLSTTNPTWIDPGANPVLRGERPATNRLSHGTALALPYTVTWVNFYVGLRIEIYASSERVFLSVLWHSLCRTKWLRNLCGFKDVQNLQHSLFISNFRNLFYFSQKKIIIDHPQQWFLTGVNWM
jgi:hypothetical protein